jgi:hypothetical protein
MAILSQWNYGLVLCTGSSDCELMGRLNFVDDVEKGSLESLLGSILASCCRDGLRSACGAFA